MSKERRPFFSVVGGRKQFNGYLYAVIIVVMAERLDATFDAFAMWLAAALLGTSVIVAIEDIKRRSANG